MARPLTPAERARQAADKKTAGTPAPPSGLKTIQDALAQYGLQDLAKWWWDRKKAGWSDAQLWIAIRDTPQFKREFPEVEARRKAGLSAMSPGEIVAYRRAVQQIGSSVGLSASVLTKSVMQKLLIADKSPAEVERRLTKGFAEIVNNAPEIRDTFQRWFGAQGDSAIAAIALDPSLGMAEVERMAAAAQIGGFGTRFGFDFTKDRGLELAQAGVTGDEAQQGLAELSEMGDLFTETISEQEDLAAEAEGAELVFGLGSGQEVRRRAQERQAATAGGGGAAAGRGGIIGLGAAE